MKSFQLILLCLVCVAKSYGQAGRMVVEITKEKHKTYTYKVIQWVNLQADSSWVQSIEKNLNQSIPVKNRAQKGKYIVSVVFIVAKDGSIADVECDKDPGFGLCNEVVRAIKKSQIWNGKVIRGQ